MPAVLTVAMGAHYRNSSSRQSTAKKHGTSIVDSIRKRTLLAAPLSILLFIRLALANGAVTPASDNSNSVVQIDFSRQLDEIDLPECSRNQLVNVTLADQEVACFVPRRVASGIQALDKLQQFLSVTPDADAETTPLLVQPAQDDHPEAEDCKTPTRLSHELHVGSPELQSYMRAARLRWLLDRCFRFSDVGVRDWRYELCIGYGMP